METRSCSLDSPLLEILNIRARDIRDRTSFPYIHNASWPRLTKFTCYNATFPFMQAFLRPTLTSLEVHFVFRPTQDVRTWLSVLDGLPHLEHLTLENMFPGRHMPPNSVPPLTQKVTLPFLKTLNLTHRGLGSECADLLDHLIFPASARRELQCIDMNDLDDLDDLNHTDHTDEQVEAILSACAAKAKGEGVIGGPKPIHALFLKHASGHQRQCTRISIYTEDVCSGGVIHDSQSLASLRQSRDLESQSITLDRFTNLTTLIYEFIARYFLQRTPCTFMVISPHIQTEERSWELVPLLRRGDIESWCMVTISLIELLAEEASLPKLETLVVYAVWWTRTSRGGSSEDGDTVKELLLSKLVRTLEIRESLGLPKLKQLLLICYMDIEESKHHYHPSFHRLKELVDDFKFRQ